MAIDSKVKRMSALEAAMGMPWDWGEGIMPMGTIDQTSRQTALNVYSGILVAEPVEGTGCPTWGMKKWGTFQYCREVGLREYRVVFDEFSADFVTDWNLQSPDNTIWTPTLTISGSTPIFTWVPGGTSKSAVTPVLLQTNPNQEWGMTIGNDGLLTTTSVDRTTTPGAAIFDDQGTLWYFFVTRDQQFVISTITQYRNLPYMRRIGIRLKFTPTSAAKASDVNEFIVGRTGLDVAHRIPGWWRYWIPEVDFVQHTRTGIRFKYTGSDELILRETAARTQTKRFKRRR